LRFIIFDSMLVLALDTTTRIGSCALARDGVVLDERPSDPEQSHAEHLPGDLVALLAAADVELEAIAAFAVATGPGSFTGLRVGIATMQGLAFATGKPLIGVSALDALARQGDVLARQGDVESAFRRTGERSHGLPGATVATWVDAWRGEVYAALYRDGSEVEPASVEHPAAVLERLRPHPRVLFIGDGARTFTPLIRDTLGDRAVIADPVTPLLAGTVAQLAHDALVRGERPSADAIRPLYVRRMDAELARDARPRQ
jgi:tRNA threonylcarbamoyladenosine biosynthesis protein TsaB